MIEQNGAHITSVLRKRLRYEKIYKETTRKDRAFAKSEDDD